MNTLQENECPDPLDAEISSWKTTHISPDLQERLVAGIHESWREASRSQLQAASKSRGRWMLTGGTLLATAVSIALAAFLLTKDRSVYAQAIAAITKVRSLHAVARSYDDEGNSTSNQAELWYEAQRGVREQETRGDEVLIRIDNGTHEWTYRGAANTVVKGPSRDPLGVVRAALEPLKMIDKHGGKLDDSIPIPEDLPNCRAYVSELDSELGRWRHLCWIDTANRLMRFEERRYVAGEWRLDEQINLRYDVDIPADRFTTRFGDARLIDRTVPLSAFELNKPIVSAERLGIVIGIHDVRRLNNDMVFVMSSSRPTDEVVDRFGKIRSHRNGDSVYGEYQWGSNGRRLPDHNWLEGVHPVEIASWTRDGMELHWVLLLQASRMLKKDSTMPVGLHIHTRGKWQEALKQEGQPWMLAQATDVLTMTVPESAESLDDVLDETYHRIQSIGDHTPQGSPVLNLQLEKWNAEKIAQEVAGGMPVSEARRMSTQLRGFTFDTTLEAWKAAVNGRIAETLKQD